MYREQIETQVDREDDDTTGSDPEEPLRMDEPTTVNVTTKDPSSPGTLCSVPSSHAEFRAGVLAFAADVTESIRKQQREEHKETMRRAADRRAITEKRMVDKLIKLVKQNPEETMDKTMSNDGGRVD